MSKAAIEVVQKSRRLSFIEAITEAQMEEMARDPAVFLMGEGISIYGGAQIVETYPDRIWNTPISENSVSGLGIGAAMVVLPMLAIGDRPSRCPP